MLRTCMIQSRVSGVSEVKIRTLKSKTIFEIWENWQTRTVSGSRKREWEGGILVSWLSRGMQILSFELVSLVIYYSSNTSLHDAQILVNKVKFENERRFDCERKLAHRDSILTLPATCDVLKRFCCWHDSAHTVWVKIVCTRNWALITILSKIGKSGTSKNLWELCNHLFTEPNTQTCLIALILQFLRLSCSLMLHMIALDELPSEKSELKVDTWMRKERNLATGSWLGLYGDLQWCWCKSVF